MGVKLWRSGHQAVVLRVLLVACSVVAVIVSRHPVAQGDGSYRWHRAYGTKQLTQPGGTAGSCCTADSPRESRTQLGRQDAKRVPRKGPRATAEQDQPWPPAHANIVPATLAGNESAGLDGLRRAGATDTPAWMIVAIPTVPRKGDAATLGRMRWPAGAIPGAGLAPPDTPAAVEAALRTLRRTPAAAPLLLSTLFSYRRRLFEQPPVPMGVRRAAARFGKSVPPAARAPAPDCGGADSDTLDCRPQAFDSALAARFHRRLTTGNRSAAAPGVGRSAAGPAPHRPGIRVAVMAMRLPHPSFEVARLLWGGEPWVEFHEAGRLRAETGGQPSVSPPLVALAQSSVGHRTAIHPAAASGAASDADLRTVPDRCATGYCDVSVAHVLPHFASELETKSWKRPPRPRVRRQSLDVARLLLAVAGRSRWVMLSEDDFWMCHVAPLAIQYAAMHSSAAETGRAGDHDSAPATVRGLATSLRVGYGLNGLVFYNGLPPPRSRLAKDIALLVRGVLGDGWPAPSMPASDVYASVLGLSYTDRTVWPQRVSPPLGPVVLDASVPPDSLGYAAYLVRHHMRRPPDHLSVDFVGRERSTSDLHFRLDWPVLWSSASPGVEPEFSVGATGALRHRCASSDTDVTGNGAGPRDPVCLQYPRHPAAFLFNLFRHDGARQSTVGNSHAIAWPACFGENWAMPHAEGFDFKRCRGHDMSPCRNSSVLFAAETPADVPWTLWGKEHT